MGTTLTAILRSGSRLGVAHIGDSRGYLLRGGRLEQITHDHTFVQTLVDEGRITEEEADHHPQRNVIMRALDGRSDAELDVSVREARAGDRYLLCSDGLSGVVSRDTLEATMLRYDDPGDTCDALVQLALRGGGPDNVTCIVADVVEVEAAPAGAPQVVGAAAEPGTPGPHVTPGDGAAQRAAALNPRPARASEPDDSSSHAGHRRRWPLRIVALAVVTGVLLAVGWGAYAWSQRQFYVGADDDSVAIYKGISQDVLGLELSEVYQHGRVTTRDLPGYSREQVSSGIPASDLDDARAIVGRLEDEAARCAVSVPALPTVAPVATPTPAPTAAPAPTARTGTTAPVALPSPTVPPVTVPSVAVPLPALTLTPTATLTPTLTPTPSPTRVPVPRGCEGVEALGDTGATASPEPTGPAASSGRGPR
jgi:protein phosphatase